MSDVNASETSRTVESRSPIRFQGLFVIGGLTGFTLGLVAAFVLSGGRAAPYHYLRYGMFCGGVGLVGSAISYPIIACIRLANNRYCNRKP
jgi:hypothetical protein